MKRQRDDKGARAMKGADRKPRRPPAAAGRWRHAASRFKPGHMSKKDSGLTHAWRPESWLFQQAAISL